MNDIYLQKLEGLLRRTRPRLAFTHKLEFKNVFGAVGGYINGTIFISCGKFGIALRLGDKALKKAFKEQGAKHLKYFPKGHVKKGHVKKEYAVLPRRILEDKKEFGKLLDKSTKYVRAC